LGVGSGSGTVTSVALTVPTGLTVAGSPITTSGTFAVSLQAGYSIPTTTKQAEWDAAYTSSTNALTSTKYFKDVMAPTPNGTNMIFTTPSATFINALLNVYVNGVLQNIGVGNDYTITGANQITLTYAPAVGDVLIATYFQP
jgi:hypothetical protein